MGTGQEEVGLSSVLFGFKMGIMWACFQKRCKILFEHETVNICVMAAIDLGQEF